jgi:carbonic anhydrase/acetyltransferase-like protein (isoleucine patch superfamily)
LEKIFMRHRPVMVFNGHTPFQTNDSFFAPTASVIGNVTAWDQVSIWYKAVVRADSPHSSITIGFNSSIGDGTAVLTELPSVTELPISGFPPDTHIGHYVVVGAGCVLKSCRIDDLVLIGDKCTILPGALVEHHCILEPGTVVEPNQRIPSGQKWGGNPAKYIADLTPNEKEGIQGKSVYIYEAAKDHLAEFLPYGNTYVHLEELERQHPEMKPTSG